MPTVMLLVLAVAPVPIVIPEPRLSGVEASQGELLAEELAQAMPATAFRVTTSAQLSTVLGLERQRQLLGCAEGQASCMAELAGSLGAEVVTQTTLARVETGYRCSVVFISAADGKALERLSVEAPQFGALLARLREQLEGTAARVLERQRPGAKLEPGSAGVRRLAWIPALAGLAAGGAGAALFGVTASTWATLNSRTGQVTDPQALAAAGRGTETAAWVLSGVGVAALATSAAFLALGGPTEPRVVVTPITTSGGAGVSISGVFP